MKYVDGQEVMIGDRVVLANCSTGEVVFCIDRGEFSVAYPESEWKYLGSGAMIKSDRFGLVHYSEADDDLVLIARAQTAR
jgi:hypothetical protein